MTNILFEIHVFVKKRVITVTCVSYLKQELALKVFKCILIEHILVTRVTVCMAKLLVSRSSDQRITSREWVWTPQRPSALSLKKNLNCHILVLGIGQIQIWFHRQKTSVTIYLKLHNSWRLLCDWVRVKTYISNCCDAEMTNIYYFSSSMFKMTCHMNVVDIWSW